MSGPRPPSGEGGEGGEGGRGREGGREGVREGGREGELYIMCVCDRNCGIDEWMKRGDKYSTSTHDFKSFTKRYYTPIHDSFHLIQTFPAVYYGTRMLRTCKYICIPILRTCKITTFVERTCLSCLSSVSHCLKERPQALKRRLL